MVKQFYSLGATVEETPPLIPAPKPPVFIVLSNIPKSIGDSFTLLTSSESLSLLCKEEKSLGQLQKEKKENIRELDVERRVQADLPEGHPLKSPEYEGEWQKEISDIDRKIEEETLNEQTGSILD